MATFWQQMTWRSTDSFAIIHITTCLSQGAVKCESQPLLAVKGRLQTWHAVQSSCFCLSAFHYTPVTAIRWWLCRQPKGLLTCSFECLEAPARPTQTHAVTLHWKGCHLAKDEGARYESCVLHNAQHAQRRDGQGGPMLVRFPDVFGLSKQHEVTLSEDACISPPQKQLYAACTAQKTSGKRASKGPPCPSPCCMCWALLMDKKFMFCSFILGIL